MIERCMNCDTPTGRAGKAEDSMYIGEMGPFCESCYEPHAKLLAVQRAAEEVATAHEGFHNHWAGEWKPCVRCGSNFSCTGNWPDDKGTNKCPTCRLIDALAAYRGE